MKWVTWEHVGVDRMACAWLIRRNIDQQAEFIFIPTGESIPDKTEPFDIPGVHYSHRQGHCTFYTFLKDHNLDDPILKHIARIVDEADVVQEVSVEPTAAGLDTICRGIRLTSADDLVALERGTLVYEALYAQLAAEVDS